MKLKYKCSNCDDELTVTETNKEYIGQDRRCGKCGYVMTRQEENND
jgi:DNA-directed RNA polymerase subunit RPC12/RpoP|tara:strand:- start:2627 stop:2764 length:138 start_codon:yes stop_codon:yes gene_type:complete